MPAFEVEVPHQLARTEARQRLAGFVDRARQIYKDQISEFNGEWTEDVLDFYMVTYGFKISGKVEVLDDKARLSGQLPFAAVAFRGKIEKSFAKELERALA